MAILFKQLQQQPSYINKTSSMWPMWSTVLQRLGSSPDHPCDSTLLYQCSLKPSQMPAYCIAHWKSFTRWQHFREGQAHSESFVKKAKQFQFCIFMRTETEHCQSRSLRWIYAEKQATQAFIINAWNQLQWSNSNKPLKKKDMIMKGSTDSAPNHRERRIIYLDCVNVKNSSVFSTMNTRQRRISSLYSDEARYWGKKSSNKN